MARRAVALILAASLLCVSSFAAGADRFVSTAGDDTMPGTLAEPWLTIQKAADTAAPGDTVWVRGGVYHEAVTVNVSGDAASGPVTFRNYPGETPVIDGTGLAVPDGDNGLFLIAGRQYLVVRGFEMRNYHTAVAGRTPVAVNVLGASHHVEIRGNRIHHVGSTAPVDGDLLGRDAHAIHVYGDAAPQSIHDVVIAGNEIHDLTLGSSEAVVLNGNVENFEVSGNTVHDVDNIAIDCIGFWGAAPDPLYDQARNGVVARNVVYNVTSYGNPAYGSEYAAGGIYVDGGRDIVIEGNSVSAADIGIEIASEQAGRSTSGITVRSNVVHHCNLTGISMGGYDTLRGSTEGCAVEHNTLFLNDLQGTGSGELLLQYDTRDNVIRHNIVYAGPQGLLIGNIFTENTGNTVDYNLYFSPAGEGGSEWEWKGAGYTGFPDYRAATGNDAHSLFADPAFASEALPDLHLAAASPAVDAGDPAFTAAPGERDIDGDTRVRDGRVDVGADERGPRARNDLVTDFGAAGVWVNYNDDPAAWGMVHGSDPGRVAVADLDASYGHEVVLGFGAAGLWVNYNDDPSSWRQVHSSEPEGIVAADLDGSGRDDLVLDFGAAGVWANYDGDPASWRQIHSSSPGPMAAGDLDGSGGDDLVLDFGAAGVWANYDDAPASWRQIHPASPEQIVVGDLDGSGRDDLVLDFGAAGVWVNYDDDPALWRQIHPSDPERIVVGDLNGAYGHDVILDFGTAGVWVNYDDDPVSWRQVHTLNPGALTLGDLDGSGRDDVILDFGPGAGIWVTYDDDPLSWRQIHPSSGEGITAGNVDGD